MTEKDPAGRGSRRPGAGRKGLPVVVVVALAILVPAAVRLIHLGADAPPGLPGQMAVYVDEGYKTLLPRNLASYGSTHWHAGDDYPGWFRSSLITQGAYYLSFLSFGPSLEAARITSVMWFVLLLGAYCFGYGRERARIGFWAGLCILAFEHLMWVFSRLALLEIAAMALVYGALLALRGGRVKAAPCFVVVFSMGVIAIFGVKLNAMMIVAPALAGILACLALGALSQRWFVGVCVAGLAGGVAAVAAVKLGVRLPGVASSIERLDVWPAGEVAVRFVANAVFQGDPFLVILGHVSALALLRRGSAGFVGNPFRCAVFSMALLGAFLLALVGPESVIRWCVLILPAHIFLVTECLVEEREGSSREAAQAEPWPLVVNVLRGGILFLLTCECLLAGVAFLHPGFTIGGTTPRLLALAAAISLPVALVGWRWHERLFTGIGWRLGFGVLVAGLGVFNLHKMTGYVFNPDWQVQSISRDLKSVTSKDAVIAGDWSPLFTLGAERRALYMNSRFNRPERIMELRPSHFLYCETRQFGDAGLQVRRALEDEEGVRVMDPVYRSEYMGRKIALHPLEYEDERPGGGRIPGDAGNAARAGDGFRSCHYAGRRLPY